MNENRETQEMMSLNEPLLEIDVDDLDLEELDRRLELALGTGVGIDGCTEFTCTTYRPPAL